MLRVRLLATLGLLSLCVLLGGHLREQFSARQLPGTPSTAAPTSPASAQPVATWEAGALEPLDAYSAMVERPLFAATRRPYEPKRTQKKTINATAAATKAPSRTVAPPRLRLVGVILTRQARQALLRDPVDGRSLTVKAHAEVEGWEVMRISPERVVLRFGRQRHELRLRPFEQSEKPFMATEEEQ